MMQLLRHMVDVGAIDCVAIGSDFDYPDRMPLLFERMRTCGFTSNEIDRIAYGNVQRVLREVL